MENSHSNRPSTFTSPSDSDTEGNNSLIHRVAMTEINILGTEGRGTEKVLIQPSSHDYLEDFDLHFRF